jgi:sarcosine oxidase
LTERRDVVVVGAGVMGLASAWALRRAGRDVTVLEQFQVGHPHGSSHGASRIFRFAYDEPEWVELAQEALPLWRELEQESGTEVLSLTGLLDARGDSAPLRRALEACSAEYELLDPAEGGRRFGIELEGEVVLELHGGIVRADRALAAFSRGISVDNAVRVLALRAGEDGVSLETSSGTIDAALAVVAAGAWTTPLLADAGIELETNISQETVAYFDLPAADILPSVIDWNFEAEGRGRGEAASIGPRRSRAANGGNEETGRHAYSLSAGENILKVGLHHSGVPVEPGERGTPDPEVVAAESEWVRRRHPAANPSPRGAETCLYTNIEEDRFVIERHGTIIGCSACSGHGFKFAPAVGTRVAALA